ncbi:hypothetical protein LTR78_005033 [Recurvomyces mirabilis]|uniref:Uncharacterized protein n=1 Tax=Recurvomyces mirabilis TaxID=574656 RepID=A0AAE0WNS4_9PEZI|nr:hypothetical protein LTR78_005033 [Recurvomyces mirabilis]KAK5158351.1 hypothetical protein LTS14_003369 [Recurvomyces mirabilis]
MADLWPTPEMGTAELMRFAAECTPPTLGGEQERRETDNNGRLSTLSMSNDGGDSIASQPKKSQTSTPARQSASYAGTNVLSRCVRPLTVVVTAIADTLPPLMHTPINDWSRELDRSLLAVKGTKDATQMQTKSLRPGFAPARISLCRSASQKSDRSPTSKTAAAVSSPGTCSLTRAGINRKRMSPLQIAERRNYTSRIHRCPDEA